LIESRQVEAMIAHPLVRAVTLTGSAAAGRVVARQAGAALKKTVLELGGSDPYIVLADADLDLAVERCVTSRLINTGQSCIAAKRFLVCRERYAEFVERFVEAMRSKTSGDPLAGEYDLGPLAKRELRDHLHDQVRRTVQAGARCLLGGAIPDGPGAYYPPTMVAGAPPGSPAYTEELFGPVASVLSVADLEEAIAVANDTSFGLGAAVFTRDVAAGERIATRLEAGFCCVNDYVRSDPRLPFGGIKESGYGRELGRHGIWELVNIKTLFVA
jgi:succinate-semialdehyde dehydrogenase/glutarate-semialdehyde dehydrogenase